ELDTTTCTGDRLCEPMRPLYVEVHIVGAPHNQRGCLESLQESYDRKRIFVIKGCKKALEVLKPLFRLDQRTKIRLDRFIPDGFRMFIRRSQSIGGAINSLIRQHRFEGSPQTTSVSHCQKRLGCVRWPVVVGIA